MVNRRTTFGPDFDVLLADGTTARIRPITPEDKAAVEDFFGRLSAESLRLRFFTPRLSIGDDLIDHLVHLGDPDDLALVVERGRSLIAIAQYDRKPGKEEAEVAFVVDDDYQGLGVATMLLEHLAFAARRHGIRRFAAVTLSENHKMQGVFRDAGFSRTTRRDGTEVGVVLDISPSAEAVAAMDERDRISVVHSMERLLRPRSVAVLGASRDTGSVGQILVRNLVLGGFEGPVFPVNPHARSIAGVPCWAAIEDVPAAVDLALVAVPAPAVAEVVQACGRKGVGALVVVSGGFSELRRHGDEPERAIARIAHGNGMRIVGPNSFGALNSDPDVSMNATFATDLPKVGRVGFASQSGGLGLAALAEARRRGMGLSSFVSMGDKADVSGNDLLTWWESDDATDVVLLYLESFGNPRKFRRIARRVGQTKPIVAVKAGRSRARTEAFAYPGSFTGTEDAVDALFRQTGVIRVETIQDLFDVGEVLAHQPLPRGRRVGIVSNASGPALVSADSCFARRLEVPDLSDSLQKEMRHVAGSAATVGNPVVLSASAGSAVVARSLDLLISSGEVDAVAVVFTPPLSAEPAGVVDAIADSVERRGIVHGVPVVATFVGTADASTRLRVAGRPVPCFEYPESAVRALGHATEYSLWRHSPMGAFPSLESIDVNEARRCLTSKLTSESGWIHGQDAFDVLGAYGIQTVSSEERRHGDLTAPRVETVVEVASDPNFGPRISFGLRGSPLELFGDHVTSLAPMTDVEARQMVLGLRSSPLLTGVQDGAGVDVDALTDLLLRIGSLADDLPELVEAELDPVIASRSGVVVSQARLRVSLRSTERLDDVRHLG